MLSVIRLLGTALEIIVRIKCVTLMSTSNWTPVTGVHSREIKAKYYIRTFSVTTSGLVAYRSSIMISVFSQNNSASVGPGLSPDIAAGFLLKVKNRPIVRYFGQKIAESADINFTRKV